MPPLRIAFIVQRFPTEPYAAGGVAQEIYRIAREMAVRRCDVHAFIPSEVDEADLEIAGIKVHRVRNGNLHLRFQRWTRRRLNLTQTIKNLELSYRLYRRMRMSHNRQPFDLGFYANTLGGGLFASLFVRIPTIAWVGSFRPIQHEVVGIPYDADSRGIERMEALQYRLARQVWAPSEDTRRRMAAAGFKRVEVVHKPIYLETAELDRSVFGRHLAGRPYLLFFGRLQEVKGFHVLAEALPRVLPELADCSVVCVGNDMPWRGGPSLRARMESLNAEWRDRIAFFDPLPHEQLYPVIEGAKLVVMPSLTEGMANACMEAMALGTPVVATLGTSFEELIEDGRSGFLARPGDPRALAVKIVEAWRSPDLDRIVAAARESAARFAPEITVVEMLRRIHAILGKPSSTVSITTAPNHD